MNSSQNFSDEDTMIVCVSVDSANKMNKISLVGMQLPQKYKENFDVSSEGPSSGVTRRYVEILSFFRLVASLHILVHGS